MIVYILWDMSNGGTFGHNMDSSKIAFSIFAITNALVDTITCIKIFTTVESSFISFERCFLFDSIEPEEKYNDFKKEIKILDKLATSQIKSSQKQPIVKNGE